MTCSWRRATSKVAWARERLFPVRCRTCLLRAHLRVLHDCWQRIPCPAPDRDRSHTAVRFCSFAKYSRGCWVLEHSRCDRRHLISFHSRCALAWSRAIAGRWTPSRFTIVVVDDLDPPLVMPPFGVSGARSYTRARRNPAQSEIKCLR